MPVKKTKCKRSREFVPDIEVFKNLLLLFMIMKNAILKEYTGYNIFWKGDYDEVFKWSEETCKKVLKNLYPDLDQTCCPWCILHDFCIGCGYGKRHGFCTCCGSKDTYGLILKSLKNRNLDGIWDLVEVKELTDDFRKLVTTLENERGA